MNVSWVFCIVYFSDRFFFGYYVVDWDSKGVVMFIVGNKIIIVINFYKLVIVVVIICLGYNICSSCYYVFFCFISEI